MDSPAPRFEIPLRPGLTKPFLTGRGVIPGPLRGVYNLHDRSVYDPLSRPDQAPSLRLQPLHEPQRYHARAVYAQP